MSAATSAPHALECDGLRKSFVGRTVLHPFRLAIASGTIHALLGQNGSGKSTLIKILSGLYEPDEPALCTVGGTQITFGDPTSAQQLGMRFVHQDLGLILEASVLDNLFYTVGFPSRWGTIDARAAEEQARSALASVGLDVDPHTLVGRLSPAQRTGVAVARAMGTDSHSAKVLVLDEPTATLPTSEVAHLHDMLRSAARNGVGILYVTHHLDEVFRLADQVAVLRDGYLVASGPVADTSRQAIVRDLVGSELESVRREDRSHRSGEVHRSARLSVRGLCGETLDDISLDVTSGEIVGVFGVTGSGRESLVGTIYGSLPRTAGSVAFGDRTITGFSPPSARAAGIAYVPADRKTSGAFLHLTAAENVTIGDVYGIFRRGYLRIRQELRQVAEWFARLNVRPADGTQAEFATFSGGNQQKIVFAKWLRTEPRVLLLDEPTQGVDVGAKAEIHRQVISACEAGLAVLISSTDIEELATLCDRVLFIANGRVVGELAGGGFTDTQINRHYHELSSDHVQGMR